MSEYQYYEFQAVDRPLSKAEQDKARVLSSRAEVNARSARFVYNYGDFRGDEEALMWDCFDAMLYIANWGTRRLLLRFSLDTVDTKALSEYTVEDMIEIREHDGKLLLDLHFQEVDQGAWLEGEGWLASLLELREDIRHGDLRLLYLAWLKAGDECEEYDGVDEAAVEPPVPAGLGKLSQAHQAFIELFGLNEDLVAAAALASAPLPDASEIPPLPQVEAALDELLVKAKTRLLQAAQQGKLADIEIELGRELRAGLRETPLSAPGRRTLAELRRLADELAAHRAEAKRRKKEAERQRALETLAKREPQAWQEVDHLCERKTASAYDEAVALLCQLRHLAQQRGETLDSRLAPLLQRWKNRPALLARLRKHGLTG